MPDLMTDIADRLVGVADIREDDISPDDDWTIFARRPTDEAPRPIVILRQGDAADAAGVARAGQYWPRETNGGPGQGRPVVVAEFYYPLVNETPAEWRTRYHQFRQDVRAFVTDPISFITNARPLVRAIEGADRSVELSGRVERVYTGFQYAFVGEEF